MTNISINNFLSCPQDMKSPLLSYRGEILSYASFFNSINLFKEEILQLRVSKRHFYLIDEENPLYFYPLLMALWSLDIRVVFPNKDFYLDGKGLNIHDFTLSISKTKHILITKNSNAIDSFFLEEGDTIVFSSGSTGKAKGILHWKEHFLDNAKSVSERVDFSSCVSITLLKPYLVSALSHFLVHYKSGAHLAFVDMDEIGSLKKVCKTCNSNSIVGSPMQIINAYKQLEEYRSNIINYFSSGDIMYPNLIIEILRNNEKAIFYDVYGLAELGGRFFINILTSKSTEESFSCIGENISGIKYKIDAKEILASSPFLFLGYIVDRVYFPQARDTWFSTGDLVESLKDNMQFIGRKNDEIKVAGNKVSTKFIEKKIASVFNGDIVMIISTEHAFLGNILNMIIYSSKSYGKAEIIRRIQADKVLQAYEFPHKFYYIEDIPYTATMKIDRNAIKILIPTLKIIK